MVGTLLRALNTEPPSPITDGQWHGNNRGEDQSAQAGGFWRRCRSWRKAL